MAGSSNALELSAYETDQRTSPSLPLLEIYFTALLPDDLAAFLTPTAGFAGGTTAGTTGVGAGTGAGAGLNFGWGSKPNNQPRAGNFVSNHKTAAK